MSGQLLLSQRVAISCRPTSALNFRRQPFRLQHFHSRTAGAKLARRMQQIVKADPGEEIEDDEPRGSAYGTAKYVEGRSKAPRGPEAFPESVGATERVEQVLQDNELTANAPVQDAEGLAGREERILTDTRKPVTVRTLTHCRLDLW